MENFIDALGEMCPIPILKAEKALGKLKKGDKLVLETDHSCSIQSVINHFEEKYDYPCQYIEVEEGIWQITIEKT